MKRNLVGKILGKIKIFVQDFVPKTGFYGNKISYKNLKFFDKIFVRTFCRQRFRNAVYGGKILLDWETLSKKNLNESRPSEHPPDRGFKKHLYASKPPEQSKGLGGTIGCKFKARTHLNLLSNQKV